MEHHQPADDANLTDDGVPVDLVIRMLADQVAKLTVEIAVLSARLAQQKENPR